MKQKKNYNFFYPLPEFKKIIYFCNVVTDDQKCDTEIRKHTEIVEDIL